MQKLQRQTLTGMRDQLGGYAWDDAEIGELVDPRLGIITGFQDLLDQLEQLRRIDLGATPPAGAAPADRCRSTPGGRWSRATGRALDWGRRSARLAMRS